MDWVWGWVLQLMGTLYMGNKPLLHVDWKVWTVNQGCGLPRPPNLFLPPALRDNLLHSLLLQLRPDFCEGHP